MSGIERGLRAPSIIVLMQIAMALNVKPAELLEAPDDVIAELRSAK